MLKLKKIRFPDENRLVEEQTGLVLVKNTSYVWGEDEPDKHSTLVVLASPSATVFAWTDG